jgi:hypothetical protein
MLPLFRGRDVDGQDDRRAENETLFRDINERVRGFRDQAGETFGAPDELVEFLCECARQDCLDKLRLTAAEYESVRAVPTDFVVAPGHEVAEIERVISESSRFTVVRKTGRAAGVARRRDPRGRS